MNFEPRSAEQNQGYSNEAAELDFSPTTPGSLDTVPSVLKGYNEADFPEDVVEATIVEDEVLPMDQFVSREEIKASLIHDAEVRERYDTALSLLEDVRELAHKKHAEVVSKANGNIEITNTQAEQRTQDILQASEIQIAAIMEQTQRALSSVEFTRSMDEEENTAVIVVAEELLDNNTRSIDNVESEFKAGMRNQTSHEKRRNKAVMEIKKLAGELDEKTGQLEGEEAALVGLEDTLEKREALQENLLTQINQLEIDETVQRKIVSADNPDLMAIVEAGVDLDSEENSDQIKADIATIRASVTSDEIKRIQTDMKSLGKRIERNDEDIENSNSLIEAKKLVIANLELRIEAIPGLIATEQAKLRTELTQYAPELDSHSMGAGITAQVLRAINRGDTTTISRSEVPGRGLISGVWKKKGELESALNKASGENGEIQWPELKINDEILRPLRDDPQEEAPTVEELTELTTGGRGKIHEALGDIAGRNMFGIIPRSFGKRGAQLRYEATDNQ